MDTPKFTLAIVGGGIGGLTLAIALTKFTKDFSQRIYIDIYESAQIFTEIGAGIGLFPRPMGIMEDIGVMNDLRLLRHIPDKDTEALLMRFRKSDQPEGISFYEAYIPQGVNTFHRAEFQEALLKHLDMAVVGVHFRKRLVTYTQSQNGRIQLYLQDGSMASCDVLVGADGIHSATRKQMYSDMAKAAGTDELLKYISPKWSGTVAYRGVVPRVKLEPLAPNHRLFNDGVQNYMGKDSHVVAYPVAGGRLISFSACSTEWDKQGSEFVGKVVENRSRSELLNVFKKYEREVMLLLECVETPSRWAVNEVKDLPTFVHERVAILGDAAHAMTSNQGSGAGQAIEDAYIFASLLASPLATLETLPQVLRVYDEIRRPISNEVSRHSFQCGRLFDFADPTFSNLATDNPPMDRLQALGIAMVENWKWAWVTDATEDRQRACSRLEELLG